MAEWCARYNSIFRTTIMGESHVWIGSTKIAHELLNQRAANYSSRPPVPAVPGSDTLPHYLPLMAHGEAWNRHRRFATTVLGASYNAHFHGYLDKEVHRFMTKLVESPKSYYTLIDDFTGRLSATMNYGSPDSSASHVLNANLFIPQISPCGPITNRLPFLIHFPEWLNPSKRLVRERREFEHNLWSSLLINFKRDYDAGVPLPPSHARLYFDRKRAPIADKDEPAGVAFGFNPDDQEFAYAIGMLTTVAIFTVGGLLNGFFLSMVAHPEWQARARAEIDAVLGDRTVATKADFANMPILRAVLKETLRWRPAVPLGVPRLVEKDDIYEGRVIKKGTIAHVVELALARDPVLYPDPEAFNPARWLEASYPTFREPLTKYPTLQGHHQFGFGKRVCPGVAYTEVTAMVACASLLRSFELRMKRDAEGREVAPDVWRLTSNLIGGPLEFEFDLVAREGTGERLGMR